MNGLMMDYPLGIDRILLRARNVFREQEIVSVDARGVTFRYTYGAFYERVLRLMDALRRLGIKRGDRVGTFAWNNHQHMELYFAIPAMGAVLHTINIKLFPEQADYIISHAQDRLLFVNRSLLGAFEQLQAAQSLSERLVVIEDGAPIEKQPAGALEYEALLAGTEAKESFDVRDENQAAGLCYTSGTTGRPKGVLYSHRSTFLHSMSMCMPECLGLAPRDRVLPVVPMFHVNAWGLPYACALAGATPVLPGPNLLGKPLADLIVSERVTVAAGVPTIWNLLYRHLRTSGQDISTVRYLVVGGAAAPRSMIEGFQKDFGVPVLHAWGMTETSPVGTVGHLKPALEQESQDERFRYRAKQGLPVSLVELRIVDDEGNDLPWDGKSSGELLVRGPWIASGYYEDLSSEAREPFSEDGWFRTGDVAAIHPLGYMEITDRKKDLIKTRGEWISSVDMENTVMALPWIAEAAVIARPDPVRGESPVVFAVPEGESTGTAQEIHRHLSQSFAQWQVPRLADIFFLPAVPKTSVGKFDKKALRERMSQAPTESIQVG